MACLSQQQLVQVALATQDKTGTSTHVDDCPICRARVEAMRGLVGQLTEAHRDAFDAGHEKARAALMAVLPARDEKVELAKPWSRIIPSIGGLTMRQRTVVGSIGAAAALALLVFWLGNAPSRVSAMERMAENIRRARSYKVTWIFERQFVRELGKPPVTAHAKSTVFWLAPGSFRLENTGDETWVGQEDTQIYPVGKPGIDIDVKKKTFQSVAGRRGRMSSIILLDELGKFSGQADQALGTKEIDGKQARGFEIDAKKIDPDGFSGPMQIWIDAESQLPVFLHYEFDEAGTPATLTMRDFQWNLDLDPKLFEARAPDGYVNLTKPSKSAEVQVRIITDGMRDYAELSGGHYPLVKMVYGDVTLGELYKMIGVKNQRPTPEQVGSNEYVKAMRASAAATHLNGILRDNPDAAYYGKTVEPKDADKILVRWKLENGQYQVIYGDLRSESVTAERLRELEGK